MGGEEWYTGIITRKTPAGGEEPAMSTVSYMIDGDLLEKQEVREGTRPTPPTPPEREGFDFVAWEGLPEAMPAEDVEVHAVYAPDSFTLTELVDDALWQTYELSSGADLTTLPLPEKEGYTFSGWVKKYKKMPKSNLTLRGSFKINRYRLTFILDDEMTFERSVEFGAPLDFIVAPEWDNHTFSGWGNIPGTMPARDLTFRGGFRLNSHTLTYVLEGEPFETAVLPFGTEIKPAAVPPRTGYVFSGWRGLPKTMPDEDVTIEGKFYQRKYKISFMVDGKKFAWETLPEGDAIVPPDAPIKRGYVFREWVGLPAVMPDRDLSVDAAFDEAQEA